MVYPKVLWFCCGVNFWGFAINHGYLPTVVDYLVDHLTREVFSVVILSHTFHIQLNIVLERLQLNIYKYKDKLVIT